MTEAKVVQLRPRLRSALAQPLRTMTESNSVSLWSTLLISYLLDPQLRNNTPRTRGDVWGNLHKPRPPSLNAGILLAQPSPSFVSAAMARSTLYYYLALACIACAGIPKGEHQGSQPLGKARR